MCLATLSAVILGCGLANCQRRPPASQVAENAHYFLGEAWQANGHWFYPRETFDMHATGVAVVGAYTAGQPLADGTMFQNGMVTGGHQTLQLPVILRVTNLANGRSILLRIDDRGPTDPGRALVLSPAAASLLGVSVTAPVQIDEDADWSQAIAHRLGGTTDGPGVTAAPVGAVETESLGPPGHTHDETAGRTPRPAATASNVDTAYPDRPAETVAQQPVGVVSYGIDGGSFSNRRFAVDFASRIKGRYDSSGGRNPAYLVSAGPFATLSEADMALDLARRVGLTGAKLIVEH